MTDKNRQIQERCREAENQNQNPHFPDIPASRTKLGCQPSNLNQSAGLEIVPLDANRSVTKTPQFLNQDMHRVWKASVNDPP